MESLEVEYTAEGWLIIDVTKAVQSWQLDYHANQGKVSKARLENNKMSLQCIKFISGLMVEILRKDNPSIQLHSTAVGFKPSREERNNQEAFMLAFFKSSDDGDSLYSKYRIKRELNMDEEESRGTEKN